MKEKLLLCVFLLLVSLGCRNDYLQNEHAREEGIAPGMVSRIISLNEAAHKNRLSAELQQARQLLGSGYMGKGEGGFTIDTDHVIYIENGPNYHTYTLKIERAQPLPGEPVENLLLTPLPDGTYKKFLVAYNFTAAEKQALLKGDDVHTVGKTEIIEMGDTAAKSIASKSQNCYWVSVEAYTWCSEWVHHDGEGSDECDAPVKSHIVTEVLLKCESLDDGSGSGGGGSGGGGDPGGGGTPCATCPPAVCVPTSPVDPQQPNTDTGDGCQPGVPTQPNLGGTHPKNTPCGKTKAMLAKTEIADSITVYKNFAATSEKKEKGFQELKDGGLNPGFPTAEYRVMFSFGNYSLGYIHTHPLDPKTIQMFSVDDINAFLEILHFQDSNTINSAYAGVIAASGNYYIKFTGNLSEVPPMFTEQQIKEFKERYLALAGVMTIDARYTDDYLRLNNQGLQALFYKITTEMGFGNLQLLKEENTEVYTINMKPDGTVDKKKCD